MSPLLPCIEIETAPNPAFAVIWLHGLGADGNDFVPLVPELALDNAPAVRFVFPHAPQIPVTGNGGYVMRAWYDILSFEGLNRRVDEAGILASRAAVGRLIERENERGIPSHRIFLAGFSQGGAMAYTTGLTYAATLAGIIALSAYLPAPHLITEALSEANRSTPIFAAHGTQDEILPLPLGEQAAAFARQCGNPLVWHTYPMPHAVCAEEIAALAVWLKARLRAQ